ncbi:MAG: 2,3-bisphosphoglycerate-independent phosphoglycerate mutase [Bacillota bacterium]
MNKKPVMLMILDGYGIGEAGAESNAIEVQGSKNIKEMMAKYPTSILGASGMDVGLPDGQMGNSEVGHLNIGAGRTVYQELTRISKSIVDGDFFENQAFVDACKNAKENGKKLHIAGLLSDGGVHSHLSHVKALIDLAKKQGLDNIYVHAIMDGRDVSPTSGADFVAELYKYMQEVNFGAIASVIGRFYAMDRDNRWDRVETAYNLFVKGEGEVVACPFEAIKKAYENGTTDEFMTPMKVAAEGQAPICIEKGDSFIFFNFRPDRAREITRALTNDKFDAFKAEDLDLTYVTFTRYDDTFEKVTIAFKPQTLENTLGQYLATMGKTQLRIAETEKYAHVTFFFNGGVETPNAGEERVLISSPKVATYDLKPEMSAYEVKDAVIAEIEKDKFDVIILNFANCDMVGHTGIIPAAVKAVEAVDECAKAVCDKMLEAGGSVLITADHGNADFMKNQDGSPFTAHTTNPVPFVLVSNDFAGATLANGKLCDIAPTMLDMMGVAKPAEMEGVSLIQK